MMNNRSVWIYIFMYRYIKCRQDVEFSIPWRYFGLFERITGYVKLSVFTGNWLFFTCQKNKRK